MPSDLDLVIRLDLGALRASLGDRPTDELLRSALEASRLDEAARISLQRAEVLWFATRLEELEAGDHVIAVAARRGRFEPPPAERWSVASLPDPRVVRYVAKGDLSRHQSREVFDLPGGRVFASAIEAPSVRRVLARGPDPARLEPEARGLVSFASRPRPPSRDRLRRHPFLGALLGEVEQVDGVLDERARALSVTAHLR
ncbi:MAG: hypothetical protein FJ096_20290 [Deltaproteobacteria bacterium]|nr:hypothetical protein [Deltaproteobacteria bacterium]